MSEQSVEIDAGSFVVTGSFGQSVRVRQDRWYAKRLIELLPIDNAAESGGQVLLTPEQATGLIAVLAQVIADAKADVPTVIPPEVGQP